MKLAHTSVVCRTRENADLFYGDILGLQQIKSAVLRAEMARKIFDVEGECEIVLYGNEDFSVEVFVTDADPNPYNHLCLEIKDRETFAENCEKRGLPVNRIPREGSPLIFVKDYDGNLFEIKEMEG